MGRGDIKSKKGKRTKGSYGKVRPQNIKVDITGKKGTEKKEEKKKEAEKSKS